MAERYMKCSVIKVYVLDILAYVSAGGGIVYTRDQPNSDISKVSPRSAYFMLRWAIKCTGHITSNGGTGQIMDYEGERMGQETSAAYFKILSQNLFKGNGKTKTSG